MTTLRRYRVTVHVTCRGKTRRFKDTLEAENAEAARAASVAGWKRLLAGAEVAAGGVEWLRQDDAARPDGAPVEAKDAKKARARKLPRGKAIATNEPKARKENDG